MAFGLSILRDHRADSGFGRMAGMDSFDTPVPANAFPLYIAHRQEV
jgi:hypothetical protein